MKNVAKCDTWCGLRSVNHRVFLNASCAPSLLAEGSLPGCHKSAS
ncbi:unnamed protein product [Brassica rapa subsp. narinosa]